MQGLQALVVSHVQVMAQGSSLDDFFLQCLWKYPLDKILVSQQEASVPRSVSLLVVIQTAAAIISEVLEAVVYGGICCTATLVLSLICNLVHGISLEQAGKKLLLGRGSILRSRLPIKSLDGLKLHHFSGVER